METPNFSPLRHVEQSVLSLNGIHGSWNHDLASDYVNMNYLDESELDWQAMTDIDFGWVGDLHVYIGLLLIARLQEQ